MTELYRKKNELVPPIMDSILNRGMLLTISEISVVARVSVGRKENLGFIEYIAPILSWYLY